MEERFKTFTVLIASISRSIRKIKSFEMLSYNLKSQHVSCLYFINKVGSLTAKELCELCDEDKSKVSRSLKYLEEVGLVSCESKHTKRYLSPIALTERGKEIGCEISERIDKLLLKSSQGISIEDLEIFYRCFRIINDNLQRISESYME